jgi:exopolysaccharide biosynthesis polyprenyl glycosylphosphotransferase
MINGSIRSIRTDLGFTGPSIAPEPMLFRSWQGGGSYPAMKRLLDVVLSIMSLILLTPVMLIVALAIKLDSSGPVIFRQTRLGKNGRPFTFYKFRSMYQQADSSVHQQFVKCLINGDQTSSYKLSGDKRITRMGKFIRKTSIDELPQFFNVLKGDMSLVGPRPPIPYEVAEYKDWHHRRLEVLPGLTGLWQVRGRSLVSFDEMVAMDIDYVEQRSLTLDLSLLLQTIPAVITGRGAR